MGKMRKKERLRTDMRQNAEFTFSHVFRQDSGPALAKFRYTRKIKIHDFINKIEMMKIILSFQFIFFIKTVF